MASDSCDDPAHFRGLLRDAVRPLSIATFGVYRRDPSLRRGSLHILQWIVPFCLHDDVQWSVALEAHDEVDVTGLNKSSESERESLMRRAGHADEEIQAGADRNAAAAD